jgi:hypothetical protein
VVTIKRISRSQVEFEHAGRTAVIEGEGLLRGHGSPDFVLYQNTLRHWAAPHETELIDATCKRILLQALVAALSKRGMTAEIE